MFQIEQEGQRQVNEEEKEKEKNHRNDKVGWDVRLDDLWESWKGLQTIL